MRIALLTAVLCSLTLSACARVEGSGRRQFNFMNDSHMHAMGAEAYSEVKASEKACTDRATIDLVERVGRRIAAAAPEQGFAYEFVVLESETANAFCLPGGKVAIYTGILKYCANEAGLAAVMGHEVAHAIARHGSERMSQQLVLQGSMALGSAYMQVKGVEPTNQQLVLALAGGAAQFGIMLPYSRHHETEADRLGLQYMAKAGYDPAEAARFWTRFGAAMGSGGPSFLSTHPASADRAKDLADHLAAAQAIYQAVPARHGLGEPVPARYR